MPAAVSTYGNAVMKDDLGVGLKNALNNNNVIWGEVTRNTEDIVGQQAVWSVHTGRSNSSGARGELDTLPLADRQRYTRAADNLRFVYHTVKVSGPAKHLTRNDEGAFIRAVESEVRGAERDLKLSLSRQTFGQKITVNGAPMSGIIATVSAVAGDTVTFGNEPTSVIRHFFIGQIICFVNPADGARRAGVYEVEAINPSAKTVTFTAAVNVAVAAGDGAVHSNGTPGDPGTFEDWNLNDEINGLRFLISATAYAGVAAGTAGWSAVTLGSGATAISEVLLDEAVEKVETDGNGSSPSLYITEHAQRRKLASLLQTQKRYEGREMTLTSGWKGLNVARGVLAVDRFCPSNLVFVLNMPDIELFVGLDFQWDEDDDGGVFFKSPTQDAIEARYKAYLNLEAVVRNSHAVITLAEPTF